MKTLIIFLLAVVTTAVSQGQEVILLGEVDLGYAPSNTKVVKTPERFTFKIDNVRSEEFANNPIGFMYENFDIQNYIATLNRENYDKYVVSLRSDSGSMVANFDEEGNLISTHQNFKNVLVPQSMSQNLYKNYKGWTMTKNKYIARTKGEVITKEVYRITLQKGNLKQKVKILGDNTGTSVASN